MMADQPNLVTTYTFKGREFLLKMNVTNGNTLELSATDKFSAEEWNCSYDSTYVENQTRKTGNFKHFEVFVTMLKSGMLKSSDCVSLDLLTFEDLEMLRSRRIMGRSSESASRTASSNNLLINVNRRYLILTYAVEFDRVHYPLPLEYCGPPDPQILQAVIRRLEAEVSKLQEKLAAVPQNVATNDKIKFLEHKVDQLILENRKLTGEAQLVNRARSKITTSDRQLEMVQKQLRDLEDSVAVERRSNHRLVGKLREEKAALTRRVHLLEESAGGTRSRMSIATEGGKDFSVHSSESHNRNIPQSKVKWRASRIMQEQARLEEMRASLQKYSNKTSRNNAASKCQSAEAICAAGKNINCARHRSCSGSSVGSRTRSHDRARHSSSLTESALHQSVKPRERSRNRSDSSASSVGSIVIQGPRSRHSSASSVSSSKSGGSKTRADIVGDTADIRRMSRKCGSRKGMIVKELNSRIKNLQKRLEGSKPALQD